MFRPLVCAVLALGVLIATSGAAPPVAARSTMAQPDDARCGPRGTALDPGAAGVHVTAPAANARVTSPLSVSGAGSSFDSGTTYVMALRDAAGGALEEFTGSLASAADGFAFGHTFTFVVARETPACVWISIVPPSFEPVPEGRLVALLPVTLLPAAGPPATMGRPSPFFENDSGPDLIAAARAYVAARSDVPVIAARIGRVVRNWAAVRLFPPPGVTDPATVILTRGDPTAVFPDPDAAGWSGVTYGTAGLCDDVTTPPILCDYPLPYAGEAAKFAIARIDASSGRKAYRGRGFAFDYPADGRVFEVPLDPFMVRVQRFLPESLPFLYDIELQPVLAGPGTVDSWAYTRMRAETYDLATCPVTGTYFETGGNVVFQVDCVTDAGLARRLYVTAAGAVGGPAAQITVIVPPEGVNPWQSLADDALTLLLNTLRLSPEAP